VRASALAIAIFCAPATPAVTDSSLFFAWSDFLDFGFLTSLTLSSFLAAISGDGATTASIGLAFTLRQDTAVIPLPAAGWLLLGGLGAARRRPAAA
jgi:hypothetical protein